MWTETCSTVWRGITALCWAAAYCVTWHYSVVLGGGILCDVALQCCAGRWHTETCSTVWRGITALCWAAAYCVTWHYSVVLGGGILCDVALQCCAGRWHTETCSTVWRGITALCWVVEYCVVWHYSVVLGSGILCDMALQCRAGRRHIVWCDITVLCWAAAYFGLFMKITVHSHMKYCAAAIFWCADLHLLQQKLLDSCETINMIFLHMHTHTHTHCNFAEYACEHYWWPVSLYDIIMLQTQNTSIPIWPWKSKPQKLVVIQILLQWHWWMIWFICLHSI